MNREQIKDILQRARYDRDSMPYAAVAVNSEDHRALRKDPFLGFGHDHNVSAAPASGAIGGVPLIVVDSDEDLSNLIQDAAKSGERVLVASKSFGEGQPESNATSGPGLIFHAISKIKSEVEPVAKKRVGNAGNDDWAFRGIEDIYDSVQPVFARYGVFSVPEVVDRQLIERVSGGRGGAAYQATHVVLRVKHTYYAEDGSSVSTIVDTEGLDTGDLATRKALTAAHHHSICQLLMLPYGMVDSEEDAGQHSQDGKLFITQEKYEKLKRDWYSVHKANLQGKTKPIVQSEFHGWVTDSVGEPFDPRSLKMWSEGDYERCLTRLEMDRRRMSVESGEKSSAKED